MAIDPYLAYRRRHRRVLAVVTVLLAAGVLALSLLAVGLYALVGAL